MWKQDICQHLFPSFGTQSVLLVDIERATYTTEFLSGDDEITAVCVFKGAGQGTLAGTSESLLQ